MTYNFDDILKKGKGKVGGLGKSNEDLLKKYISNLMNAAHKINSLYAHNKVHHMNLDGIKCNKCEEISFKLSVRDISDPNRTLRFFKKGWKNVSKGKYRCPKCGM